MHFPELLIRSLDFERIARLQAEDNWLAAGTILNTEAKALERGGADLLPCDKHDALTALHIDCAASASYFRRHSPSGLPLDFKIA